MKPAIPLLLLFFAVPAFAGPADPWSVTTDAPVMTSAEEKAVWRPAPKEPVPATMAALPFLWLLRFHQTVISPVDGDRCGMYPTCSQYGILAIRKHGPLTGTIMTIDRLMHEQDEYLFSDTIRVGSRMRVLDPVENNDCWWTGE